jgi:hypothetical protein
MTLTVEPPESLTPGVHQALDSEDTREPNGSFVLLDR